MEALASRPFRRPWIQPTVTVCAPVPNTVSGTKDTQATQTWSLALQATCSSRGYRWAVLHTDISSAKQRVPQETRPSVFHSSLAWLILKTSRLDWAWGGVAGGRGAGGGEEKKEKWEVHTCDNKLEILNLGILFIIPCTSKSGSIFSSHVDLKIAQRKHGINCK